MEKKKREVLYYHSTKPQLKDLSRREVVKCLHSALTEAIYGDREDFVVFRSVDRLTCLGPKIFWRNAEKEILTFKGGKFYGNLSGFIIDIMIQVFGWNWIDRFCRMLLRRDKRLWAMVIQGKITNPEQLAKKYSKMYFKSAFSYRALKYVFDEHVLDGITLSDVYYYTSNPELFVLKAAEARQHEANTSPYDYDNSWMRTARDVIEYCRLENAKMNPNWSVNRLTAEHQKQIERDMLVEIQQYPDTYIAPPFEKDGLELILSERDCFKEGVFMHNCVHRCYWRKVKKGDYILVKGKVENTYVNIGIYYKPSYYYVDEKRGVEYELSLDQIHTIYNGNVNDEITKKCMDWINKYRSYLVLTCEWIKEDMRKQNESEGLPF